MSGALHEASVAYWGHHQVADLPLNVTAEQSFRSLEERNSAYPGFAELMSWDHPGKVVLDFGCGPGHDVIEFLRRGAAHVYAVDCSPRAVEMVRARVRAHGWEDRCTAILHAEWENHLALGGRRIGADHVNANGVIQHVADSVGVLAALRADLAPRGDAWMMVYSAESHFYQQMRLTGQWDAIADGGAPIARAWTNAEVVEMCADAGLMATHLGNFRGIGETTGPGLSSCWRLVPA